MTVLTFHQSLSFYNQYYIILHIATIFILSLWNLPLFSRGRNLAGNIVIRVACKGDSTTLLFSSWINTWVGHSLKICFVPNMSELYLIQVTFLRKDQKSLPKLPSKNLKSFNYQTIRIIFVQKSIPLQSKGNTALWNWFHKVISRTPNFWM